MTTGVFNVVSDICVLLIPQRTIWKMQMPLHRKPSLSAIFLVGLFAYVSSGIRVDYSRISLTYDTSYNVSIMGWWVFAEMSVSIISGSLRVLPKLFQSTWARLSTAGSRFSSQKSQSLRTATAKGYAPQPDGAPQQYGRYYSVDDHERGLATKGKGSRTEMTWMPEVPRSYA
ncbi:hypothetical protein MMC18_009628 [Xylographa bjoerkii]|nr:hypothetical protein [Xylographa bjoerkii]